MAKQTRHHSIHFSEEEEEVAKANMKEVGVRSLNAYVVMLVRGHREFLRGSTDRKLADLMRAVVALALKASKE